MEDGSRKTEDGRPKTEVGSGLNLRYNDHLMTNDQ